MAVRKLKGSWWVDFQFRGVRVRRRSPLNARSGALEYEVEIRRLISQCGSVQAALQTLEPTKPNAPTTFRSFAERWLRDYAVVNNKPSEQRNKRSAMKVHLVPAFGELPLAEVAGHSIEQFKAGLLQKGLSPKSINNFLTILRKCLDTAVEWGELSAIPRLRKLKTLPPPFRFLSADEVEMLLANTVEEEWRVLILAAVRSGMRFGELSALRWGDIDFDRAMIHVHRSRYVGVESAPKSHRERYSGG